jgi:hypothetical protein
MNDLRGKREVENKTETHKTDGWKTNGSFFSQIFEKDIFLPVKIVDR